jgi:hypothetical protein
VSIQPTLPIPFIDFLRANRETLNAQFAEARRIRPTVDPADFAALLRTSVGPIVDAVDHIAPSQPDQTAGAARTLYDLSLDLLGQELLGPRSRYPFIAQGWQSLFPALAAHLAAAPRAVVGSLTNALYNLSLTPGAHPELWLDIMHSRGPRCATPDDLFRLGQIAAWRAGLAHYRRDALDLCRKLDASVVQSLLSVPNGAAATQLSLTSSTPPIALDSLLDRLAADPWLDPAALLAGASAAPAQLKTVARAGAFRGFGGLFLAPPKVAASGEHFVARDGGSHWLLTADLFGATFHRSDDAGQPTGSGLFQVDRTGRVTLGRATHPFPELADFTSVAATSTTLAVTTALSHSVYLIAMA